MFDTTKKKIKMWFEIIHLPRRSNLLYSFVSLKSSFVKRVFENFRNHLSLSEAANDFVELTTFRPQTL